MNQDRGFHRIDSSLSGNISTFGFSNIDNIMDYSSYMSPHGIWFKGNGIPLFDFFDTPSGFNDTAPFSGLWGNVVGDWKVHKDDINLLGNGSLKTTTPNASISFTENYPVNNMFYCYLSINTDILNKSPVGFDGLIYKVNDININYGLIPGQTSSGYYAISDITGKVSFLNSQNYFNIYFQQNLNHDRSFIGFPYYNASRTQHEFCALYDESINNNITITAGNLPPSSYFKIDKIIYTKPNYNSKYDAGIPSPYNFSNNGGAQDNRYNFSTISRPINYMPGPANGLLDKGGSINAVVVQLGGFEEPPYDAGGMNDGVWFQGNWVIATSSNYSLTSDCLDYTPTFNCKFYPTCSGGIGNFFFKGQTYSFTEYNFSSTPSIISGCYNGESNFESAFALIATNGNIESRTYGSFVYLGHNTTGCMDIFYLYSLDSGNNKVIETTENELPIAAANCYKGFGGLYTIYDSNCGKNMIYDCCPHTGAVYYCVDWTWEGRLRFTSPSMYTLSSYDHYQYDNYDLYSKLNGTFIIPYSGNDNISIQIPYNSTCSCPLTANNPLAATLEIDLNGGLSYGYSPYGTKRAISVSLEYSNITNIEGNATTSVIFNKTLSYQDRFETLNSRNSEVSLSYDGSDSVTIPAFRYIQADQLSYSIFGALEYFGGDVYDFEATTITIPSGIGYFSYNSDYYSNKFYYIFGFSDGKIRGEYWDGVNYPSGRVCTIASFEPDQYLKYYGRIPCSWENQYYGVGCSSGSCTLERAQTVFLNDHIVDGFGSGCWQIANVPSSTLSEDLLTLSISGMKYYDKNDIFHKIENGVYSLPLSIPTGLHRLYFDENNNFCYGNKNYYTNAVDNTNFNIENDIYIYNLYSNDYIYNWTNDNWGKAVQLRPYNGLRDYRFMSPVDTSRFIVYSGCKAVIASQLNGWLVVALESISGIPIKLYGQVGGWNGYQEGFTSGSVISYNYLDWIVNPATLNIPNTYVHLDYGNWTSYSNYTDNNITNSRNGYVPIATLYKDGDNIKLVDDRIQSTDNEIYGIASGFPGWGSHRYGDGKFRLLNVSCQTNSGDIDFLVNYYNPTSVIPTWYYRYYVDSKEYIEAALPKKFTLPNQTGLYSVYYDISGVMNLQYGNSIPEKCLEMCEFYFIRERRIDNGDRSRVLIDYLGDRYVNSLGTHEYQSIDNSKFTNLNLRVTANSAAAIPDLYVIQPIYSRNPTCQVTIIQN